MFGKLSGWIFVLVVATTFALGGVAQSNTLSHVQTRVFSNWNNSGSDVCFVRNSNNVAVSAVISVFPVGTAVLGVDNWTFPVVLGPLGVTRVFSWAPPVRGTCTVLSVQ